MSDKPKLTLQSAVEASLSAVADRRADRMLEQMRTFKPDPQLDRELAAVEQMTANEGRRPHLPAEYAARLSAYRNRKAAAAAFADTDTGDDAA